MLLLEFKGIIVNGLDVWVKYEVYVYQVIQLYSQDVFRGPKYRLDFARIFLEIYQVINCELDRSIFN